MKAAACEWCISLLAIPGKNLCQNCQRMFLAELPALELAPRVGRTDLEVEHFLRGVRSVGGNF